MTVGVRVCLAQAPTRPRGGERESEESERGRVLDRKRGRERGIERERDGGMIMMRMICNGK